MNVIEFIQNFLSGTFAFVVLLGLLIFVHELGHFSVARWCGVRVETFSLGFGKKIWQRKRGDTTYCISIIPFGGYVKMYGDQPGAEVPEEEKKYSFTHKTVWQRMAVVFAGPLVNFLFAIFVFTFIGLYGEDIPPAKLGDIESSTKAYQMGFRSGDTIVKAQVTGDKNGAAPLDIKTLEHLHDFLTENIGREVQLFVRHENSTDSAEPAVITASVEKTENKNPMMSEKFVGDIPGFQYFSKATSIGLGSESPLWAVGLRPGDRILSVNESKVKNWRELNKVMAEIKPGQTLNLAVERLSPDQKKTESLNVSYQTAADLKDISLDSLKISSAELYLNKVVEKSPADTAGLKAGDKILSIQDKPMTQWEDVLNTIKSYKGEGTLKVVVLREGQESSAIVEPKMTSQTTAIGTEDKRFTIGISPYGNLTAEDPIKYSISNPFVALGRAVKRTVESSQMMLVNLGKLVSGEISSKNIGGIISIGQAAHETFKRGLSYYLHLMAILSINLFILNLLPVPVLDGGHLVFYTIEVIKGSPLSLKKMELAQQAGMVLLFALMFYAMYNDFIKFIMPG